jgi:hypothetical protein
MTTAELVTELRSSRTDLARIVQAVDRDKRSMLVVQARSVRALGAEGTQFLGEGAGMAGGT